MRLIFKAKNIKRPGSRGSTKWWVDMKGNVRYGDRPAGRRAHEASNQLGLFVFDHDNNARAVQFEMLKPEPPAPPVRLAPVGAALPSLTHFGLTPAQRGLLEKMLLAERIPRYPAILPDGKVIESLRTLSGKPEIYVNEDGYIYLPGKYRRSLKVMAEKHIIQVDRWAPEPLIVSFRSETGLKPLRNSPEKEWGLVQFQLEWQDTPDRSHTNYVFAPDKEAVRGYALGKRPKGWVKIWSTDLLEDEPTVEEAIKYMAPAETPYDADYTGPRYRYFHSPDADLPEGLLIGSRKKVLNGTVELVDYPIPLTNELQSKHGLSFFGPAKGSVQESTKKPWTIEREELVHNWETSPDSLSVGSWAVNPQDDYFDGALYQLRWIDPTKVKLNPELMLGWTDEAIGRLTEHVHNTTFTLVQDGDELRGENKSAMDHYIAAAALQKRPILAWVCQQKIDRNLIGRETYYTRADAVRDGWADKTSYVPHQIVVSSGILKDGELAEIPDYRMLMGDHRIRPVYVMQFGQTKAVYPKDTDHRKQGIPMEQFFDAVKATPQVMMNELRRIEVHDTSDANLRITGSYAFASTQSFGDISFWQNIHKGDRPGKAYKNSDVIGTIVHEAAHCLDRRSGPDWRISGRKDRYWSNANGTWATAAKNDAKARGVVGGTKEKAFFVRSYAKQLFWKTKYVEDFACSAEEFILSPSSFTRKFPYRTAVLREMIGDVHEPF